MIEFYVLVFLLFVVMVMWFIDDIRHERERDRLYKSFEEERRVLLDRIQARDLSEFKAYQSREKKKEPEPTKKEELIPL